MEMGFDEKEVIDALRVNNNQQDAAVSAHIADCSIKEYSKLLLLILRLLLSDQTQADR